MAVISVPEIIADLEQRWAARMCSRFVVQANVHNRRSRRGSEEINSSLRVMRQGGGTELNLPQSDYECIASGMGRRSDELRRMRRNNSCLRVYLRQCHSDSSSSTTAYSARHAVCCPAPAKRRVVTIVVEQGSWVRHGEPQWRGTARRPLPAALLRRVVEVTESWYLLSFGVRAGFEPLRKRVGAVLLTSAEPAVAAQSNHESSTVEPGENRASHDVHKRRLRERGSEFAKFRVLVPTSHLRKGDYAFPRYMTCSVVRDTSKNREDRGLVDYCSTRWAKDVRIAWESTQYTALDLPRSTCGTQQELQGPSAVSPILPSHTSVRTL
ncbi:hypothetical protein BDN71DRAFT_1498732 [Pleurotus eryngii]|uniref:Uncharacterized protein n=1 Tax=Pleurotus eryngii TaxID=5323 RepID=A0A9P5ZM65_PLEER|nr:hypothetical protein BDN71DRAFT_1498732 [Pleurotus eryngii]